MGLEGGSHAGDSGFAQAPDLTLTGLSPEADIEYRSDMLQPMSARVGDGRDADTSRAPSQQPMYVTDLTHFLDKSGAIGPVKGPARAMAQFQVDVVAHATDATFTAPAAPRCFKCKKVAVEAARAQDDAIVWFCPKCRSEGRISNWQGSLWDLRNRPAAPY